MRMLPAIMILAAIAAPLQATFIPFTSAADLNHFSMNGPAHLNWNGTAGVGGSGGIISNSFSLFTRAAIHPNPIPVAIDSKFFAQLDVKIRYQGGGPDVQLGFNSTPSGVFDGAADFWIESFGTSGNKSVALQVDGQTTFLPGVSLVEGDWYRYNLTGTKMAEQIILVDFTILDLGTTGLGSPMVIYEHSLQFNSAVVGNAPVLYSGFHLWGQTFAADNFTSTSVPIPEPGALAACMVTALALARRRRILPWFTPHC